MTFKEYLDKNEKSLQNMKFENIDEFKKFADKEKISYSEGELKQAWGFIKGQSPAKDGSLDDDALDAVAGGAKGPLPENKKNTWDRIGRDINEPLNGKPLVGSQKDPLDERSRRGR